MMKYFIIGILILGLLVGLCIFAELEIETRSRAVSAPLEEALVALRDGAEQTVRVCIDRAADAWAESESVFASFISHDHTNRITEALAELPWLQGKELGQSIESILKQVQGLAEMDEIIWKNLL